MSRLNFKTMLQKGGYIQTIILLTILYFLIGIPVALIMRLVGYNPYKVKLQNGSFWQDRAQKEPLVENYLDQF